ncbi:MAG: DUF58 domain-containing protein [Microthrixaceae bacterium]
MSTGAAVPQGRPPRAVGSPRLTDRVAPTDDPVAGRTTRAGNDPPTRRRRIRLSRAGTVTTVGASALIVASVMFGTSELRLLGVSGLAMVIAAVIAVAVGSRRFRLAASTPRAASTVGRPVVTTVVLEGLASRWLSVRHESRAISVPGTARSAHRWQPHATRTQPLLDGAEHRASPRLVARLHTATTRRGRLLLPDRRLVAGDPWGLAAAVLDVPSQAPVTVLADPDRVRFDDRGAVDVRDDHDTAGGGRPVATLDEVDRLRPFVDGDEVRRIHWPSTARLGVPIVRTSTALGEPTVNLVLDLRAGVYADRDELDDAIAAATAIVRRCEHDGLRLRCATTTGLRIGERPDAQRVALALATEGTGERLAHTMRRMTASDSGAVALVVIAGRPVDPAEREEVTDRLAALRAHARSPTGVGLPGAGHGIVAGTGTGPAVVSMWATGSEPSWGGLVGSIERVGSR